MKNNLKNNKTSILLIIAVVIIIAMFYFVKQQKSNDANSGIDMNQIDSKIQELDIQQKKISELLDSSKKTLNPDTGYISKLKKYVQVPITDEEIKKFVGPVNNPYPFGNPISDKNADKK